MKDEESGTQEIVQLIQTTTVNLQKASLLYRQRRSEWDKLKNDGSASVKEIERAESKSKKALEDYRNLVEKYNVIRADFERKMTISCKVSINLDCFSSFAVSASRCAS